MISMVDWKELAQCQDRSQGNVLPPMTQMEVFLNISELKQDEFTIVLLNGRLDAAGAPEVESHCKALIANGSERLILDMTAVEYISSAGLRSLLVLAKSIKNVDGKMGLCCLTPMVAEVMEISGFDKLLLLEKDLNTVLLQLK